MIGSKNACNEEDFKLLTLYHQKCYGHDAEDYAKYRLSSIALPVVIQICVYHE